MRIDKAPEGGKFRATAAVAMDGQAGTWGDTDMLCVDFDSAGALIVSVAGTGEGVIYTREGRKPLDDGTDNEVIGGRVYTVFTFCELTEAEIGSPTLAEGDLLYASAAGIVDLTPATGDIYIGRVLSGGSRVLVNVNGQVPSI